MNFEKIKFKKLFVVGDKFKCFMSHSSIIGVSELENMIYGMNFWGEFDYIEVHVGQGVCEIQLKKIYDFSQKSGINNKIKIVLPDYYHRSSKSLTHKHRNENILISEPIHLGESVYKCNLMLNDNCAEMSDHVTGQHIQGMVMIEAARQMVLAVTEKFMIATGQKTKPNFFTNSINVEFKKFIFPLEVEMIAVLTNIKRKIGNNLVCSYHISFRQNDNECVIVTCSSSVLDSEYAAERETFLASECIKTHLKYEPARM